MDSNELFFVAPPREIEPTRPFLCQLPRNDGPLFVIVCAAAGHDVFFSPFYFIFYNDVSDECWGIIGIMVFARLAVIE